MDQYSLAGEVVDLNVEANSAPTIGETIEAT
jgi:hypothetical protein